MYESDYRTDFKESDPRYPKTMHWIKENIKPRKTPNYMHTSYGIKHLLQRDTGIYLTNGEFKDAMIKSGYDPVDSRWQNWAFCISEKSEAFKVR